MKKFKYAFFWVVITTFLFGLLICKISDAAQATLSWKPNSETDLEGYRVYYGEATRDYVISIKMPKSLTKYTIGGLEPGKTYYFAATAHDNNQNESGYSNEVSYTVPILDETPPDVINIEMPAGGSVNINIGNP